MIFKAGVERNIIVQASGIVKADFSRMKGIGPFGIMKGAAAADASEQFNKIADSHFLPGSRIVSDIACAPDSERHLVRFRVNLCK